MKELINKFKKLDQTKRIVILFITISFVFIAGFSIYNEISGNYQNGNTAQVTQVKDTKEKNTKKNKEEKQENKEDTNTQQEETTKQEENKQQESSTKKEENTTQESTAKKDDSSKQETKNETSKNINQSSTASSSTTESTGSTQESSNANQSSNTTSNNTSNNTNTSQSPTNNKITVNVKVNGMGNIMMSGTLNVEKGATGYSVLKQLADQNGIGLSGSKIYVSGIGDLHEKQHGPMSGWMYSVNGVAPNKAACYYTLNDGDSVVWYYVNYN